LQREAAPVGMAMTIEELAVADESQAADSGGEVAGGPAAGVTITCRWRMRRRVSAR